MYRFRKYGVKVKTSMNWTMNYSYVGYQSLSIL